MKAREAQKKAAAEAAVIIANNKAKQPTSTELAQALPQPPDESQEKSFLNITQLLMIGSIVVSLIGIYYKREELKSLLSRGSAPNPGDPGAQPSAPAPQAAPPKGLRKMDRTFAMLTYCAQPSCESNFNLTSLLVLSPIFCMPRS